MSDQRWVSAFTSNVSKNGTWNPYDDAPTPESSTALAGYETIGEAMTFPHATSAPIGAETDNAYLRKGLGQLTGNEYVTYQMIAPNYVSSALDLWACIPGIKIKRNHPSGYNRSKAMVMLPNPTNPSVWNAEALPVLDPGAGTYSIPLWVHGGTNHRAVSATIGYALDINGDVTKERIPHSTPVALKLMDTAGQAANITEFWEAGILLEYTTRPVSTIGSITGLTSSGSPVINWTATDADGYDIRYVHVVVHTATGLTNPAQSGYVHNAIYDSPNAALKVGIGDKSQEAEESVDALEPATTYYAYVRTVKEMPNGVLVAGAWTAASSFTITAAKPVAPTLAVANNNTYEKVLCTITDNNNRLTYDNCSFEQSIADWANVSNVEDLDRITTPTPDHGDYALRINPISATTAQVICNQLVEVKPATSYSVSAKARKAAGLGAVGVAIRWYDINGATISTTSFSSTTPTTSSWTTTTQTGTSPANAVRAAMLFQYVANGVADYAYLDSCSFAAGVTFGPGLEAMEYELERSEDQLTWTPVAHTPLDRPLWAQGRISDYGATRNTTAYYRARVSGVVAGVRSYSDWVTANDAVTQNTYWRMSEVPSAPIARIILAQVTATNVATLTCAAPHGFTTGDTVIVTNCNTTFNYNATYTIRSCPTPETFTVVVVSGTVAQSVAAGYAERIVTDRDLLITGFNHQIQESVGVFKPLGSPGAVYVSGGTYNADGSFHVMTTTLADWLTLEPLLKSDQMVVVTHPNGQNYWMKLTGRDWSSSGSAAVPLREVDCEYAGVGEF